MRLTEDSKIVDLELFIHVETEKAVLASETGDNTTAVWIPRSQIEIEKIDKHGIVIIAMPEWLAVDKGLI